MATPSDKRDPKRARLRAWGLVAAPSLLCFVLGLAPGPGRDNPQDWSADQWALWRDAQISRILEPTVPTGEGLVLARDEVVRRSSEAFRVVERVQTPPSLSNFVSFVKAQHWMALTDDAGRRTHELGLTVSDHEYWEYAYPLVELPPLLRSQEFLRAMASPKGYRAAVQMVDRQNSTLPEDQRWTVLPYEAQFILSVDRTTYGRLLIVVPNVPQPDGGTVDQWIQFAIATPGQTHVPDVKSVSVVALRSGPVQGEATRAAMMDYVRLPDVAPGRIQLVPNVQLPQNPSKNCYDCHKSPVIPIRPLTEYDFGPDGALVPKSKDVGQVARSLNSKIMGYGLADLGVQDTAAYGPCLGPVGRPRTDADIRRLVPETNLSDDAVRRVRDNMVCSSCHDHFAPLNYLLAVRSNRDREAFKSRKNLVQDYVERGWMPPGNTLTPDERTALWKCLSREYFDPVTGQGLFVDWLKGSHADSFGP